MSHAPLIGANEGSVGIYSGACNIHLYHNIVFCNNDTYDYEKTLSNGHNSGLVGWAVLIVAQFFTPKFTNVNLLNAVA